MFAGAYQLVSISLLAYTIDLRDISDCVLSTRAYAMACTSLLLHDVEGWGESKIPDGEVGRVCEFSNNLS